MKKKLGRLNKRDITSMIGFYKHFKLPVTLELSLISARYNSSSQRKGDLPRIKKIILTAIATRQGVFSSSLWDKTAIECKRLLKGDK